MTKLRIGSRISTGIMEFLKNKRTLDQEMKNLFSPHVLVWCTGGGAYLISTHRKKRFSQVVVPRILGFTVFLRMSDVRRWFKRRTVQLFAFSTVETRNLHAIRDLCEAGRLGFSLHVIYATSLEQCPTEVQNHAYCIVDDATPYSIHRTGGWRTPSAVAQAHPKVRKCIIVGAAV